MSAVPVSRYLTELEADVRARSAKSSELAAEAAKSADAVARLAESYSRGLAEGRAVAQAEYDDKLAQQIAAAEAKLAAERERWIGEEGSRLAELFLAAVADFETRIAEQVAQVLKPVLEMQVRQRAIGELAVMLEGLLADGDLGRLTISGPEDLLRVLSARLSVKINNVTFNPAPGTDLKLVVDETVLETRIGDWMRTIEGSRE